MAGGGWRGPQWSIGRATCPRERQAEAVPDHDAQAARGSPPYRWPPGPVPRAGHLGSLQLPLTLRGAGLHPGVVDEELFVELDEPLRLLRGLVLGEDRLHRTYRLARSAVDTLVGVYEELIRALVDTVDRADLDTGLVLDVDTRLGDDIRHGHSLSGSQVFHDDARYLPKPLRLPLLGRLVPRAPRRRETRRAASASPSRTPILCHRKAAGGAVPLAEQEGEEHVPLPARHGQRLV